VGPGVITGAADDDPSGIATYAQAGASFGYRTLWLPVLATPLMAAVQEMCARIGIVTRHGLAGTMRRHYSGWLLYPVALAMLGTTISPYLFFWQASTEAEEKMLGKGPYGWFKRFLVSRKEMTVMRQDVGVGMVFSNLAMYFVTMAAAGTLFRQGVTVMTAADVAGSLAPIAGEWAGLVFALGIIGTGALAIPVLAGSAAYAASEALGWQTGLNKAFGKAKAFYSVMAISAGLGLGLTWLGLDAVKMLFWTAVMYGLMSPPLVAVVLHVANNRRVMGKWVNGRRENILGIATLMVMTLAGLGLLIQ
jgi:Mn2+/Fe2+ NRAMP family transporter